MVVEIKVEHKAVGELSTKLSWVTHKIPLRAGQTMRNFVKRIVSEMRHIINTESVWQNTGWLSRSISTEKTNKGYIIYSMNPYARYVDEGTKPHFIPFGFGRIEGVDHPGARAMYFSDRAFRKTRRAYMTSLSKNIRRTFK